MIHDQNGNRFNLPKGMSGRFGVIKLWPDIQVAEDEVIARMINAARLVGLECVVLDQMGRARDGEMTPAIHLNLDFVISLHFSTPKCYDVFSFVTLWNPIDFFHDFGYRDTAANLITHDDFLSCGSISADAHLARLTRQTTSHLTPDFHLYHSLATPILPPTIGAGQAFYMGINWERLGKGGSRHQDVLNQLDSWRIVRIFGPVELRGVKVWEGFEGYQGSLPFDGVSAIAAIHEAGICLALSSQPHKNAALMSNRLFEGLAAGALIICDENSFARTHFGDSLLYVDMREGAAHAAAAIRDHVAWAVANPTEAVALATRAQEIFKRRFIMDASLTTLYEGLPARKAALAATYSPKAATSRFSAVFLLPDIAATHVGTQAASAVALARLGYRCIIAVDAPELAAATDRLARLLGAEAASVTLVPVGFSERDSQGRSVATLPLGPILKWFFDDAAPEEALCFIAAEETIFSNHLPILAGLLEQHPEADYVFSKALVPGLDAAGDPNCIVERSLSLTGSDPLVQPGLARFLFRASAFAALSDGLLGSLALKAAEGLALYERGICSGRASVILAPSPQPPVSPQQRLQQINALQRDVEAIRDWDPVRFTELDVQAQILNLQHEVQMRSAELQTLHEADLALQKSDQALRDSNDRVHTMYGGLHDTAIGTRDGLQRIWKDFYSRTPAGFALRVLRRAMRAMRG